MIMPGLYNEDRKRRYFEDTGSRQSEYTESLLRRFSKIEHQYGKDICELNLAAISEMFAEHFGIREHSRRSVVKLISDYTVWCKNQGYPVSEEMANLSVEQIDPSERLRRTMVASPKHLGLILDSVFDPVEDKTTDCLYRCCLWLAYSGLQDPEIENLLVDQIDLEHSTIKVGVGYYIYPEEKQVVKICREEERFLYRHAPKNPDPIKKQAAFEVWRERKLGPYLLRGIRTAQPKLRAMYTEATRRLRAIGYNFSPNTIRMSGYFYEIFDNERAGVPPNFDDIVVKQSPKSASKQRKRSTENDMKRNLLLDYENWKKAFP